MKFFPTENLIYKTKLKETEILRRLSENIEPENKIRIGLYRSGSSISYEGFIKDHGFKITRIISYRNTFIPQIFGNIEKDYDGTKVKIKMRLHVFVSVFLCMLTFGYVLTMRGFKFEANKSKNFLQNLLEAAIVDK